MYIMGTMKRDGYDTTGVCVGNYTGNRVYEGYHRQSGYPALSTRAFVEAACRRRAYYNRYARDNAFSG